MMVVMLLGLLFATGWPQVLSLVCRHGGTLYNATYCNCTGTCFSGATCHIHSGCGVIPSVNNSQQHIHTAHDSCHVTVTYTCDVGYNYTSRNFTSSVKCEGTTWSDEPDTCERITCPRPPFPAVPGSAEVLEYVFGDVLQYNCEDFHTDRDGMFTMTCLGDGTWSGGPAFCKVRRLTVGLVIGLSITATLVLLLALLPYDFFTYHKRQTARRRHARLHRVGILHATPSPGVSPYLSPKTPGRATTAYRPYSLLSEEARAQVCERLRHLTPEWDEQLPPQDPKVDSYSSSTGDEPQGEEEGVMVEAITVKMVTVAQNQVIQSPHPPHKPLMFPAEPHLSYIDDDDDEDL